jgi:uroporphyrinogen III methyltransferase/synthase
VRNFLALLGPNAAALLGRTKVGCIGPITAETAADAGLDVAIQPAAYTVPAFADAILQHFVTGTS